MIICSSYQHHFLFVNYKSLHLWCLNVQRQFKVLIICGIWYTCHDQYIFVFTILIRFLFNVPRENAASSSLLYSLIPRAKRQTSWITLLWHLGDTWLLWVILHKSFSHSGSNITQCQGLPSNSGFTIYARIISNYLLQLLLTISGIY